MTNAANLSIVITGDTSSAKKAMRDLIGDADKMDSSFKRIRDTAAGVLSANVIERGFSMFSGFLKSTVSAANEAEQAQTQLGAVLKSTGYAAGISKATLNEWAQSLQLSTTYSDEAVNHVQSLLLTFTNIGKNVLPEAQMAVLNMSTALGQDLQSSAIQVGKAMQDPITGMTALRRVGVAFTDDQEKLVKQLVATGQGVEAQKMILAELAKEFGGSASAATNTFAGKLAILNNKFDEMKETIGRAIINAILPYLNRFSAWFTENQAKIERFFVTTIAKVAKFGEDFYRGLKRVSDGFQWIQQNAPGAEKAIIALAATIAISFGPGSLAYAALFGIVMLIGRIGQGTGGGIQNMVDDFRTQGINRTVFMGGENVPATMGQGTGYTPENGMFDTIKSFDEAKVKIDEMNAAAGEIPPTFNGAGGAADKLKTALTTISEAFSKLTSGPTRELADKQLKLAELQVKIAEGEAKGYDMSKSNVQQEIDRITKTTAVYQSHNELLNAQMTAANGLLLTEKERDRIGRLLIDAEKISTGHVQTFGEKLANIFPSLDQFPAQLKEMLDGARYAFTETAKPKDVEPTGMFVDGTHAMGLRSVPFDGYVARLHQGERVLTASEARNGSGGPSVIHVHLEMDGKEIGRKMIDLKNGGAFRGVFT